MPDQEMPIGALLTLPPPSSPSDFELQASFAVAAIDHQIRSANATVTAVLKQVEPILHRLQESADALGVVIAQASPLGKLLDLRAVAASNDALLATVDGVTHIMAAMAHSNRLRTSEERKIRGRLRYQRRYIRRGIHHGRSVVVETFEGLKLPNDANAGHVLSETVIIFEGPDEDCDALTDRSESASS